jgi:hypothetical protein
MSDSAELLRLATIERGSDDKPEQLRISLDEFTSDDRKRHRYVSIRLWYDAGGGEWRPTKKGATIRRKELEAAAQALRQAAELIEDEDPAGAARAGELRRQAQRAKPSDADGVISGPSKQANRAKQTGTDDLDRIF